MKNNILFILLLIVTGIAAFFSGKTRGAEKAAALLERDLPMEQAVRENDYVLIVCTPRYKEKSDGRVGGVGYEGDIMTAEVMAQGNDRKFIPVLREGEWAEAAPSWILGKRYVDLRGAPYSEKSYDELLDTLHGRSPQAPPIGRPSGSPSRQQQRRGQEKPPNPGA